VFTSLVTDGRTNGQVEDIMPPRASLAWQRHRNSQSYPVTVIIAQMFSYFRRCVS